MTVKSTGSSKVGRPPIYTVELAEKICFELAQGKSLRTVCKMDGIPDGSTIFSWFRLHEEFSKQYARAKQEAADAMAEDILDISDDNSEDEETRINSKTGEKYQVVNQDNIQRARLRVDTRKWLMAKMKPKKYSERLELEDLPQHAIIFVNEVPAPQHNSPTGDLLPDDQSDPDPNISGT
jgi:hypothetical protein